MSNGHLAYAISPYPGQIRVQPFTDFTTASLTEFLECSAVDSFPFDGDHTLYFDDEGLQDGIDHYFALAGHTDPLVGKLLITANHGDRPLLSMREVVLRFNLFRPVIDPVIKSSRVLRNDLILFTNTVDRFEARIAQFDIEIVENGDA